MDAAEKKLLDLNVSVTAAAPHFVGKIAGCADGEEAKLVTRVRAKGIKTPDVGPTCLAYLEHIADADLDPKTPTQRPDKQLLAYPALLGSSKGLNMTGENAKQVIQLYVKVGEQPQTRTLLSGAVPVSAPGNTQEVWVFNPNNAFIASFIDTVRKGRANQPIAPATTTSDALVPTLNQCFGDVAFQITNKVVMGPCTDAGQQAAALYLTRKAGAQASR